MSYTNGLDDPSAYFQTAIYTGNGSTQSITNDGNSDLQPDWVWVKNRGATNGLGYQHQAYDSSRGTTKKLLPSATNVEATDANSLTAFNSDGFSAGSNVGINENAVSHVAWQWKSNAGTTVSNTDGDITSTVQVNQNAGFSIVTDSPTNTTARSIGHGLGVAPQVVIRRARTRAESWRVFHSAAGSTGSLKLNDESVYNSSTTLFTGVTSTTFGVGTDFSVNGNYNYVSYCFAEKQGYSKFGSYKGNSNTDGPFVYTGFKPAWVMIKKSSGTGGWVILDNKRNTFNVVDKKVAADKADAESTVSILDFLSNGFKLRVNNSPQNQSGGTYIYMAFAENSFVTSKGIPTTAR